MELGEVGIAGGADSGVFFAARCECPTLCWGLRSGLSIRGFSVRMYEPSSLNGFKRLSDPLGEVDVS